MPRPGARTGCDMARWCMRSREPTRSRLARVALLVCLTGCYAYIPVDSPVTPGTRVAVELNDQGGAELRGVIGSDVAQVEGAMVHNSDTAVVVSVWKTHGRYGALNRWSGEQVSVRREYVRRITERRLSRSRTTLAVAGVAAGVLAFVLSRNLLGLGGGDVSDGPPNGGGDDQ